MGSPQRAVAYYCNRQVDLLSGRVSLIDINQWIGQLREIKMSAAYKYPRVIHLFYEFAFLVEAQLKLLNVDSLLAIDIEYETYREILPSKFPNKINLAKLSAPNLENYTLAFEEGYQELLRGNCYQFNLTCPFRYSFKENYQAQDFIFSLWQQKKFRGAFASATFIPYLNQLFLSNSPECLFQYKNQTLSSMPIKGTLKRFEGKSWKPLWQKLIRDKKSQAELYMIADLLRNDLSRIELPRARITLNKAPMLVPGLLHQYSQVDVELSNKVSLWRVIEKIFPGGSITGAPKVRAMRLIHQLESRQRGFYCGSSLILFKKMKSASLNIRSAQIDFTKKELIYQAGGGITLLSRVNDEFQEMIYKHDSFISTLTAHNC